jgi:tight adherence protein B
VLDQINLTAEFTNRTGAAAVTILRALATDLRRDHQQLASEKIEQLSIRLLLPIGLLVLPAFGLLTVVPIAFGFLSSAT